MTETKARIIPGIRVYGCACQCNLFNQTVNTLRFRLILCAVFLLVLLVPQPSVQAAASGTHGVVATVHPLATTAGVTR